MSKVRIMRLVVNCETLETPNENETRYKFHVVHTLVKKETRYMYIDHVAVGSPCFLSTCFLSIV